MLRHLTAIILGLLMSAPSDGDSMSLRSPGGNEGGAYPTEGVNQLIEALMVIDREKERLEDLDNRFSEALIEKTDNRQFPLTEEDSYSDLIRNAMLERVLEENAASEAGRDNEDVDVGSEPRLRPLLRPLAEEEEAYQSDPYQAENGETSFTPADERRPTDEIFDDRNFDARAALTAITKAISDLKMERPGDFDYQPLDGDDISYDDILYGGDNFEIPATKTPWNLNPYLRKLVEIFSQNNQDPPQSVVAPSAVSKRTLEDNNIMDMCPELDQLTTGCSVADDIGLNIDSEARQLCQLHHLCYVCGAAYGITDKACDNVYLGEASRLCLTENDAPTSRGRCMMGGVQLYVAMMTETYEPAGLNVQQMCRSQCVKAYLSYGSDI